MILWFMFACGMVTGWSLCSIRRNKLEAKRLDELLKLI
jgi:hypothetical protein